MHETPVSCSGSRPTTGDPHALGGAHCGEQRRPNQKHTKEGRRMVRSLTQAGELRPAQQQITAPMSVGEKWSLRIGVWWDQSKMLEWVTPQTISVLPHLSKVWKQMVSTCGLFRTRGNTIAMSLVCMELKREKFSSPWHSLASPAGRKEFWSVPRGSTPEMVIYEFPEAVKVSFNGWTAQDGPPCATCKNGPGTVFAFDGSRCWVEQEEDQGS